MANTKVVYSGDGINTMYNVPFPYLDKSHVYVEVNQEAQLTPLDYVWVNSSTIQFVHMPQLGDAIEIKRVTPRDTSLVNFQNSAVLTAADLNLSQKQTFYITQEISEGFYELINNSILVLAGSQGVVETDPDMVVAALVYDMLNDASAATLQARVSDIDNNAEAIVQIGNNLQTQINTLAQGIAAVVFVQAAEPVPGVGGVPDPIPEGSRWYDTDDNNKPYIYISSAWVSIEDPRIGEVKTYINALETEYGPGASSFINEVASISTEAFTATSALSLLGAVNGGNTAFILDSSTVKIDTDTGDTVAATINRITANETSITTNATAISGLGAKYGVTLNVGGYITGFAQNNDGQTGAFVVMADKFAVVTPTTAWAASTAYSVGDMIRPTTPTSPSRVFRCTTAGTSGVTEPSWNTTISGTTNDGSAVWTTFDDNAIQPFLIDGDSITLTGNVQINGNLLVNGTVGSTQLFGTALSDLYANMGNITAGTITLNGSGHIKGGATAFNSGIGYWLGYDSSVHKFFIGDSGGDYLTWDGTELLVAGNLVAGEYLWNNATTQLAYAGTARTASNYAAGYQTVKQFTVDRPGSVKITYRDQVQHNNGTYSSNVQYPFFATYVNDVLFTSKTITNTSVAADETYITGLSRGDVIKVKIKAGQYINTSAQQVDSTAYIDQVAVKGEIVFPTNVTVQQD